MIVRNEGATLEACLQSIRPYVDQVVIGLAGESTDDTQVIAEKYADIAFTIPWEDDFAKARNRVLDVQLAAKPDYFMWLDGDDEVVGGENLRRQIEMHPKIGAFHMYYDYSRESGGGTTSLLVRERVLRSDLLWRWEGRIHEYLRADVAHDPFLVEDVLIRHHGEHKVRGLRNLELLYRELEESEPEPSQRLLHYLGSEEALHGNYEKALLHLRRYIGRAEWSAERYQATHLMAELYRRSGDLDRAVGMEMAAIRIQPDWPDAYFGLAEVAFRRGEWLSCVEWTATGFARPVPRTSLIINPRDYDFNPLLAASIAFANLGRYDEALGNLEQAYSIQPTPSLLGQITGIKEVLRTEAVLKNFLALVEHLARNDEWLKVRALFSQCPKSIETHERVRELWGKVQQMTAHVEDPQLMADHYVNNPGWAPMPDETILSENWMAYPRLAFAHKVAKDLRAHNVVDLGCSDGFISLPLAKAGFKVDGLDLDPRCIKLANERAEKWGLKELAGFTQGAISSVSEWAECADFYKYDLAILFETIEHVVDPAELLETVEKIADHVVLTTPYLAWERGEIEDWDKVELKGHLRIFDLVDMEQLLNSRGRISNLYRQEWGLSAWIFADYTPGIRARGPRISFVAPPALEKWGPQKLVNEGIGGSETALIKLAAEFSKSEYQVTVFNDIDSPGYYDGVRYRDLTAYLPEVKSDITIAWRFPELADMELESGTTILWMHDTDAGTRLTRERAEVFDKIVVLSKWHKQHMMSTYPFIPEGKFLVIGNGVTPENFTADLPRNLHRVVYTSSPDRGLDVILEHIWPQVVEAVPDAELHYFYGWNNIDAASGVSPKLQDFKRKVSELSMATRNVTNRGRVTQQTLAKELLGASIWLYPTYFHETFCISAVEAQMAGLHAVTNNLAALAETIGDGPSTIIYGNVGDRDVRQQYVDAVITLLQNDPGPFVRDDIKLGAHAKSWSDIASLWEQFVFQSVLDGSRVT
jgi:glycosyltransferase involved in cell wall biosynthesis